MVMKEILDRFGLVDCQTKSLWQYSAWSWADSGDWAEKPFRSIRASVPGSLRIVAEQAAAWSSPSVVGIRCTRRRIRRCSSIARSAWYLPPSVLGSIGLLIVPRSSHTTPCVLAIIMDDSELYDDFAVEPGEDELDQGILDDEEDAEDAAAAGGGGGSDADPTDAAGGDFGADTTGDNVMERHGVIILICSPMKTTIQSSEVPEGTNHFVAMTDVD